MFSRTQFTVPIGKSPAVTSPVRWQVIEFEDDDAQVRNGTNTLNAGNTTVSVAVSPSIADLSKAFLIHNYEAGEDD